MGRPSKDRVRRTYTIDKKMAGYIDSFPDGERSNFVNRALRAEKERFRKMINYEVAIIAFDGNIEDVNAALNNAGIQTNPEEAASQNKESSVYVSPMEIGQAVQVINGLGYETDEDEE